MVDRNRCSLSHLPRSDNLAQNVCRSDSERGPCKQTWRKRSQQQQSSTSSESNVHSRQNDFMKGLKIGPNGGDAPEAHKHWMNGLVQILLRFASRADREGTQV